MAAELSERQSLSFVGELSKLSAEQLANARAPLNERHKDFEQFRGSFFSLFHGLTLHSETFLIDKRFLSEVLNWVLEISKSPIS